MVHTHTASKSITRWFRGRRELYVRGSWYRAVEESRPDTIDLEAVRLRLPEIAARLHRWVMEISEDDMELVLAALQVQVFASREEIQIEGSIPVIVPQEEDLVTIERTSASLQLGA